MSRKPFKIKVGMSELSQQLGRVIGQRSVESWAEEHKLPHWIVRDLIYDKVQCPSARYLPALAKALKVTTDQLVALAYQEAPPRPNGATIASGKTSTTTS